MIGFIEPIAQSDNIRNEKQYNPSLPNANILLKINIQPTFGETSSSHGGENKDVGLLGCSTV